MKLFYFSWLANKTGKESEELSLPRSVTTIGELLKLLQMRRPALAPVFDETLLRPTLNKQFAEFFSRLEDGDEVALVPNRPTCDSGALDQARHLSRSQENRGDQLRLNVSD